MSVVVLILVTWFSGASPPDVTIYAVKDMQTCHAMAESFMEQEEQSNSEGPYPARDRYAVSCEIKNGNEVYSP